LKEMISGTQEVIPLDKVIPEIKRRLKQK